MNHSVDWLASPYPGPLGGMRVLDASQQLPGPYATALLASLGADVIKVEPPAGDAGRHFDPEMFRRANAGKRRIRLDLKSAEGREALTELARGADVFVEGFRPGVTARLGCDYKTLQPINPAVVYCAISGFGQHGPLARRPTHDISLQAMAGALPPEADITRIGVPWVDLATGTTAALVIVSAWHAGHGGFIDLAMLDAAVSWAGIKPEAVTELEPSYGTFITSDGGRVIVALLEDPMWARLCTALGWDDWAGRKDLARYRDRRRAAKEVRQRLADSLAALSAAEAAELGRSWDLPIESIDSADPTLQEQLGARRAGRDERTAWLPIPVDWQTPTEDLR